MNKTLSSLLLLAFLFFLNFLSRIIFSPLLPVVEKELGLNYTGSGSLFLCISSGYFISILLSSFVNSVLNHKVTIFLSTFCSGIVIIVLGLSESLLGLLAGLFCLGLAAGLYLPSALASIAIIVPPQFLARGMAVHELAPNIGFVAAPLVSEFLLSWLTWRETIQALGLFMMCVSCIYIVFGKGGCEHGRRMDYHSVTSLFRQGRFWLMTTLFSLAICSTLGVYAMLPLFLVTSHNMEATQANTLVASSRICSILMPLIGGWLGDNFGNRRVVATVLVVAGILTACLGGATGKVFLLIAILQPMVAVCFFPSGFALLAQMSSIHSGGLVVSLCIPFAFLAGGGLMPTIIGIIGDHFSFHLGFIIVGVFMIIGGLSANICSRINEEKI